MKSKRSLLLSVIGGLLVLGLSWAGCKTSRAGYEGPEYEVTKNYGEVEIRRYEKMVGVATSMAPQKSGDRNSGFGRLFRYITGANEREEKIAMTSPVFIESDDEASENAMLFLMPKEIIEAGVPTPSNEAVNIKPMDGGTFAVLRFKGHKSKDAQRAALTKLRETIETEKLTTVGDPIFAYYDPPWTPELLRRNEVLLRVKDPGSSSPSP